MRALFRWLNDFYQIYKQHKANAKLSRRIDLIVKDQNRVYDYLKKEYFKPYLFYVRPNIDLMKKGEKIVWQYWDSGVEQAPLIVRSCIYSVSKNLPQGYQHIILNDKNLNDYIQIPDWVIEKKTNNPSFRLAFFSDILRLCLLEKYGGVWIDATIFLSSKIPERILVSPFFVFYRGEKPPACEIYERFAPYYFSWRPDFRVKLCNSFIVSDKCHPFVCALKDILLRYWKEETEFQHYFVFQMLFDQLIKVYPYSDMPWTSIDDLDIHRMQFDMKKPFNEKDWKRLCSLCFAHKLTFKYMDKGKKSFFHYIENIGDLSKN